MLKPMYDQRMMQRFRNAWLPGTRGWNPVFGMLSIHPVPVREGLLRLVAKSE